MGKYILFWSFLIKQHTFFVKETPKFVAGHREQKQSKNSGIGWVYYGWYYPLSFKEKLYYPIAYLKFMKLCIRQLEFLAKRDIREQLTLAYRKKPYQPVFVLFYCSYYN